MSALLVLSCSETLDALNEFWGPRRSTLLPSPCITQDDTVFVFDTWSGTYVPFDRKDMGLWVHA